LVDLPNDAVVPAGIDNIRPAPPGGNGGSCSAIAGAHIVGRETSQLGISSGGGKAMRAAVMRNKKIVVDDIAIPTPGAGEVLVKTLACGICGSDLHTLKHAEKLVAAAQRSGGPFIMDLNRDIVMGHEFCAEVVDYGPNTQRQLKTGARVCAMPVLIKPTGVETVGYSNDNPGGYGEYMRLTEALLLPVANGLSTERAALTEPMSVGYHAVQKARVEKDDAPLVIGCGPVGLAVIAALKLGGAHPIVAADFSLRRRELAQQMGADVVIDPGKSSPFDSWRQMAVYSDPAKAPQLPPWLPGPALRPAVIFECVGVPGVIDSIMAAAPANARVVVVGVCMERDQIEPMFGINKELNIQFVLGYSGKEFAATLQNLAEGKVNGDPLITGKVGVGGVAKAFEELASPERHAKILVEPSRA
jgi:threonine dehydrogenase-like Zn-dependent dehydrogenase